MTSCCVICIFHKLTEMEPDMEVEENDLLEHQNTLMIPLGEYEPSAYILAKYAPIIPEWLV